MTQSRDAIVAVHEAAHAVVQYRVTGSAGGAISIVPKGEALGTASDCISDSLSVGDMEGRILSLYAGGHAQRIVDRSEGDNGCDSDDEIAAQLLHQFGWSDREQELRDRALELVRRHWPEVAAVSDELQAVRVLDATEIEILTDVAAGVPGADLGAYRRDFGASLEAWRVAHVRDRRER